MYKLRFRKIAFILIAVFSVYLLGSCAKKDSETASASDEYLVSIVQQASTGPGRTLFESANDKCQHCHYDLHDSWENSMHAQSWSDQIFQTKYREFLRHVIVNKIGKSSATTFNTKTASKVGAICASCHAPSALASGDMTVVVTEDANAVESNVSSPFDTDAAFTVIGTSATDGKQYSATVSIGHKNNREGISCAFCHSIEEVHMTKAGDTYVLKSAIKPSPISGTELYAAGSSLAYNASTADADMNAWFKLVGPELYKKPGTTYAGGTKKRDGRYRLKPIPTGKGHFAGGPYYGPYGMTGTTNESPYDKTDRAAIAALAKDNGYDSSTTDNHFEDRSKALCLSCHQRSAGADDTVIAGKQFMELCTTWSVTENNVYATDSSPKCAKCHMERRTGVVINEFKQEGVAANTTGMNQTLIDQITANNFHSHEFEGAGVKNKIAAALTAVSSASAISASSFTATVSILNNTAHMLPGAHPMRRMAFSVRAVDADGTALTVSSSTIATTYNNDTTFVYADARFSADVSVPVKARTTAGPITLNGWTAYTDGTFATQKLDWDGTTGTKRIVDSGATDRVMRLYGRQTLNDTASTGGTVGTLDATDKVAAGFASNTVIDNRMQPNQKEVYSVAFSTTGATLPITLKTRVYYLRKGAGGTLPFDSTGELDTAKVTSKKLKIIEVHTTDTTVN